MARQSLYADKAVASLLVLGLLLARERPAVVLAGWRAQAGIEAWTEVVGSLQAGFQLPHAEALDALMRLSQDSFACMGAAVKFCRSESASAQELVIACSCVAQLLLLYASGAFKKQLLSCFVAFVADRLAAQVLGTLSASANPDAVALSDAVGGARQGTADIQQLLRAAALATHVNFGIGLRELRVRLSWRPPEHKTSVQVAGNRKRGVSSPARDA
ncbi:MAG: hypothetical protein MZW92_36315 [Comamonadaceae bacterium]|nr:hypothetical protein [Comamonadaceae bacterium]